MAVTNEKSTQLGNLDARPVVRMGADEWDGGMYYRRANFTQGAAAGDIGSTQALIRLPAGKIRLHLAQSRIANSAFGAARTLDLGWQAYTKPDGTAVVADANGLDAAQDVSGAGSYSPVGTVGGDETFLFESKEGVVIEASVAGGTIPAGATLDCDFYYSRA